jgi:hypothetical protein
MASATGNTEAKAQHYIPHFYLKGFTDRSGKLWVYERFKPLRASTPKDEAHKPDYYTHSEKGYRDETAETTLEAIESQAARPVCKLANPQFTPSSEQMGYVYLFVALMFARVPSWRENLDKILGKLIREFELRNATDREKFHKLCADMERDTGKPLGMDYEKLRQYVLKGEYEIRQGSTAFNLGSMFESALGIAKELQNYGNEVLYAPKGLYFLTSDSPVFTVQPDGNGQATIGLGFGWPRVLVHFPLNKRACLRLTRGVDPAIIKISESHVERINRITMANATKCLYAPEGYRKVSRLFDQWGCKIEPGKNAFMPTAQRPKRL